MVLRPPARFPDDLDKGRGFRDLAVFGSVARGSARIDSDIDLLVKAPRGTSIRGILDLQETLEQILGRSVDLVSYGGLVPGIDDDLRRAAVLL